jgi:competence protein ComEA
MYAATDKRKRRALGLVTLALAATGVAGWRLTANANPAPALNPIAEVAPGAAATSDVLVFVSGAVLHPGLYRLSPDARGSDAVAVAGGLLSTANLAKLPNLAAKVHDGHQINIPTTTTSSGVTASARLDINSASLDELQSVPGMPLGLPQAIINFRDLWGGFQTMSELRTALGVDSGTESQLSHYLRVVPTP